MAIGCVLLFLLCILLLFSIFFFAIPFLRNKKKTTRTTTKKKYLIDHLYDIGLFFLLLIGASGKISTSNCNAGKESTTFPPDISPRSFPAIPTKHFPEHSSFPDDHLGLSCINSDYTVNHVGYLN